MNQSQDLRGASGIQFTSQVSCDQSFDQHNNVPEAPLEDGSQMHVPSKKNGLESIKIVQNLIERCMQLYLSKEEVLKFLSEKLGIRPDFATLVWQKLEEENADFFQVYNTRLKLKKQIQCFNELLQKQYSLMEFQTHKNVPLARLPSGSHQMPVNNLPVGYPALQQPAIPATVQLPIRYTGNVSDCHAVNRIPEMNNLQVLGNDFPPCSSMMDRAFPLNSTIGRSTMVAPTGQFHFTSDDPPGHNINNSALNPTFASDMSGTEGLPLEPDGTGMYYFQSFPPVAWSSSFTDPNTELLSAFEGAEEFFADSAPGSGTQKEDDFQLNESAG